MVILCILPRIVVCIQQSHSPQTVSALAHSGVLLYYKKDWESEEPVSLFNQHEPRILKSLKFQMPTYQSMQFQDNVWS